MKKYKLTKQYQPATGVLVETGSIVYLSEQRGANARLRRIASEVVEEEEVEKKKKKSNIKNEE